MCVVYEYMDNDPFSRKETYRRIKDYPVVKPIPGPTHHTHTDSPAVKKWSSFGRTGQTTYEDRFPGDGRDGVPETL